MRSLFFSTLDRSNLPDCYPIGSALLPTEDKTRAKLVRIYTRGRRRDPPLAVEAKALRYSVQTRFEYQFNIPIPDGKVSKLDQEDRKKYKAFKAEFLTLAKKLRLTQLTNFDDDTDDEDFKKSNLNNY